MLYRVQKHFYHFCCLHIGRQYSLERLDVIHQTTFYRLEISVSSLKCTGLCCTPGMCQSDSLQMDLSWRLFLRLLCHSRWLALMIIDRGSTPLPGQTLRLFGRRGSFDRADVTFHLKRYLTSWGKCDNEGMFLFHFVQSFCEIGCTSFNWQTVNE